MVFWLKKVMLKYTSVDFRLSLCKVVSTLISIISAEHRVKHFLRSLRLIIAWDDLTGRGHQASGGNVLGMIHPGWEIVWQYPRHRMFSSMRIVSCSNYYQLLEVLQAVARGSNAERLGQVIQTYITSRVVSDTESLTIPEQIFLVSSWLERHSVTTSVTTYAETVIYYKYSDPSPNSGKGKFVGEK